MKSMVANDSITLKKTTPRKTIYKKIIRHWQFYLLILIPLILLITFKYYRCMGRNWLLKTLTLLKGINGSPWAGFKHFQYFFEGTLFLADLEKYAGHQLLWLACRVSDSHPFCTCIE